MGGGTSKEPRHYTDIDTSIRSQYSAHCNPLATSLQELNVNNVEVVARDRCKIYFLNKATVNTSCNMGLILDNLAEQAASAGADFARQLQSEEDAQANDCGEADECTNSIRLAIRRQLHSACGSGTTAQQTLNINGGKITCTDDAVVTHGNYSEVTAVCLTSVLQEALERTPAADDDSSDDSSVDKSLLIGLIIGGVFLLLVGVAALRNWRRQNPERRHNSERRQNPERRHKSERRHNSERPHNSERRQNSERRENSEGATWEAS